MDPERIKVYLESLDDGSGIPDYLKKIEKKAREDNVPIIRPATRNFMRMLVAALRPSRILEVGCAVGYSALIMQEVCPDAEIITIERDEKRGEEAAFNFSKVLMEQEDSALDELFALSENKSEKSSEEDAAEPKKAGKDGLEVSARAGADKAAESEEAGAKGAIAQVRRWNSPENKGSITLLMGDADEILPSLKGHFDLIFMDAAKGQYIVWLPEIKRLLKTGSLLLSDNILQEGDILESHYAVERRNRTIYKRMRSYLYELTHDDELITSILSDGDGMALSVKK